MSKHTPGPWRTTKKNPRTVCNSGGDKYIAKALVGSNTMRSPRFVHDEEVAQANACLIAAAPDMAESGRAYFDALDAKRTFESENPNDTTKRWAALLTAIEVAEDEFRAALHKAEAA